MTPVIAMPAVAPTAPVPVLPALSALLHGATRLPVATDWRAGVLSHLGITDAGSRNVASVAACAVAALPPGSGVCLAAPVHVVAGMSRVFLAGPESFVLDMVEREELRQAFNAEFGSTDLQLHAAGSGWLLQSPCAGAADDGSPDALVGTALAREPATSPAGRSLRRLGAEVEMWLAGLAFNSARERSGRPPINCFWFWGGGTTGRAPAPVSVAAAIFTSSEADPWATGLAAHCGVDIHQGRAWGDVRDAGGAVVLLQPPFPGNALSELPGWEAAWFAPVQRDLASGRLPSLRLQAGQSAWLLPAPRLARLLRRRRPWWQSLSA